MGFTRRTYDKELEELQREILRMGSLVETAINEAIQSLSKQDCELAKKVMQMDDEIDRLELVIEDHCMRLIATQQPMAGDLRRIGMAFRIITDLERMGDHAYDIAKIALKICDQPLIKPLIDIPHMGVLAQKLVKNCLDAFVQSDVELAKTMGKQDDEVDRLYAEVKEELMELMSKKPETVFQAVLLMNVARLLERIADHAKNIGDAVVFSVTGDRQN